MTELLVEVLRYLAGETNQNKQPGVPTLVKMVADINAKYKSGDF